MLGCCRNFWGDFGANAFKEGLLPAVNSEKMQYARGMLTGSKPEREDIPCTTCEIYLDMKAKQHWLKRYSYHPVLPPTRKYSDPPPCSGFITRLAGAFLIQTIASALYNRAQRTNENDPGAGS